MEIGNRTSKKRESEEIKGTGLTEAGLRDIDNAPSGGV